MSAEQPRECTYPRLFPFITVRPERFGAIVFNPYLGTDTDLNPVEAFIARLCRGHSSLRQIEEASQRQFGLSPRAAQRYCSDTVSKLRGLCALAFRDAMDSSPRPVPDTPVLPEDGPALSAPKTVIWDVTYACNLRCPHCLTASGRARQNELNTAQALALADRLAQAKVLSLSLSGGEPFLRPDILVLLRHLARTNMRVDIATNGVELPPALLHALRDLPIFQVQVSIDGLEEQHDRFRGRRGAFTASCGTIRRLREEGIATSISTTVTHENVNALEDLIALALELGCSGFKAIPFVPAGRGRRHATRMRLTPTEHYRLCRTLHRRAAELAGRMVVLTEITFACLLEPPPEPMISNGPMGCSAGYDTLSIGADGTVYPCPFLHMFPLGNLLETPLQALWFDHPTLRTLRGLEKAQMGEPCRSCAYAPARCRGGCRAAAYLQQGNLHAADPMCFMTHSRQGRTAEQRTRPNDRHGCSPRKRSGGYSGINADANRG